MGLEKMIKKIVLVILSTVFLNGCVKSSSLVTAQLGDSQKLQLEVVNTPQSITQGLSGRDEIGADGMLFVFDRAQTPRFWMKEMKFDLDMIWIKEMKVVEITKNVPAPDLSVPLNQLPTYGPNQPVEMVLEVEAGKVGQWGIEVGDELIL